MIRDAGVVAGNVYDKYNTKNPVARALMRGFMSTVERFALCSDRAEVLEVGCGEGHLLELLSRRAPMGSCLGVDLSPAVIAQASAAHPSLRFDVASVYELPFEDRSFSLVIACEVLEHLEDPEAALVELARVARRDLILTVPREPLWRALNLARGRYLGDLGNTPGHVQHFSRRDIVRLVERHFRVREVASPTPWTAIRASALR